MQDRKQYLERPVPSFRRSERVPKHNLDRCLDELLGLLFVCAATAEFYRRSGQL